MKDAKVEQDTGQREHRAATRGDGTATRLVALNTLLELARAEAAEEAAIIAGEATFAVATGGEVGK